MLHYFINGQHLTTAESFVVDGTIDHLQAHFCFSSSDWQSMTEKWAHFASGESAFDMLLINDRIEKERHLNLTAGEWEVWVHGIRTTDGEVAERITTNKVRLMVSETGSTDTDNMFPSASPDMVEQIYASLDSAAEDAVEKAIPAAVDNALAQAKASGEFDGEPGKDGKDGADGKTPVKGEDYFTDADKAELVNAVLSALPDGDEVNY